MSISIIIIPREIEENEHNQQVALMIPDNIDNLESTLGGSGTSYEVNSVLVIKGKSTETDDLAGEAQERKTCRKKVQTIPTHRFSGERDS